MQQNNKIEASTQRQYTVKQADLPLSCPTADMQLWNSHPRVFLPIQDTGKETCPYCGSEFVLENFKAE